MEKTQLSVGGRLWWAAAGAGFGAFGLHRGASARLVQVFDVELE
jgi:hypothetical protein